MKHRKTDIPSIIPQLSPSRCYFCTKQYNLEKHHVIPGTGNKRLCVDFGLWVWLCHDHHRQLHDENKGYRELQIAGQKAFIADLKKRGLPEDIARDEWYRLFGKYYD